MQRVLSLETKKYLVKIPNFEGPLDLLCHLIDKNKMKICDIQISKIADQYMELLDQMEELNLEIASEFLVMASTLLYLKSKSLLPVTDVEDEKEISEEELIRRIIEYKKYKEIAGKLKLNYIVNSKGYFKAPEAGIELPKQILQRTYSPLVIPKIYETLVEKRKVKINENAKNIEKIAIIDYYTVSSKVKQIFKQLRKKPSFVFRRSLLKGKM